MLHVGASVVDVDVVGDLSVLDKSLFFLLVDCDGDAEGV